MDMGQRKFRYWWTNVDKSSVKSCGILLRKCPQYLSLSLKITEEIKDCIGISQWPMSDFINGVGLHPWWTLGHIKGTFMSNELLISITIIKCAICRHISIQDIEHNVCTVVTDVGGGWGLSKVVATCSHVGGSFNLFMATTGDDWIIPSFQIWNYVLHVEHISCVITTCGQHQWVIPSPLSIAL